MIFIVNSRVHLLGHKNAFEEGGAPWAQLNELSVTHTPHRLPLSYLAEERMQAPQSAIVSSGSVDSAYLRLSAQCISTYDHHDVAALLVAIEYMTGLEVST